MKSEEYQAATRLEKEQPLGGERFFFALHEMRTNLRASRGCLRSRDVLGLNSARIPGEVQWEDGIADLLVALISKIT